MDKKQYDAAGRLIVFEVVDDLSGEVYGVQYTREEAQRLVANLFIDSTNDVIIIEKHLDVEETNK